MNESIFAAVQNGALKNAYLIVCPCKEEAGAFLNRFLKMLYCENHTACGACPGCEKVESGNHVDILSIRPEKNTIKIEQTREVAQFIAGKPFEGKRRTVVIENAEFMTVQAQNSLLKSIEEPQGDTVFLLTTANAGALLRTVVSRCERVFLPPEGVAQVAQQLKEEGVSPPKAKAYAALAGGYYKKAKQYTMDEAFQAARQAAIHTCLKICRARRKTVVGMVNELLPHEEKTAEVLDEMVTFFRDMLVYKITGSFQQVINQDCRNEIKNNAQCFTILALEDMIEILLSYASRKQESKGMNTQLMLMAMLFDILEVKLNVSSNRCAL